MKLTLNLPGAALSLLWFSAFLSMPLPAAPPSSDGTSAPSATQKIAADTPASSLATRNLRIDPSSMPVAGGKATLTIGLLQREKGVYTGTYKITVNPYFFKNENGRLAIVVSDQTLAQAGEGKVVTVTGTATASGQGGEIRRIDAIATPAAKDHGSLKLWFTVGERKMTFEPSYHFAEPPDTLPAASTPPSTRVKRAAAASHAGVREEVSLRR